MTTRAFPPREPAPQPAGEIRLTTARLLLRRPTLDDVDAIVAGIGDWEVAKMLAKVPHPYSRSDGVAWVTRTAGFPDGVSLMVVDQGAVVGCVGIQPGRRGWILGYWLAQPAWGKGYATEAAAAVLGHAFADLNYGVVHSGVLFDNFASLRVQAKLGFTVTGRSEVMCLARNARVEHIDTVLTRARHLALSAQPD